MTDTARTETREPWPDLNVQVARRGQVDHAVNLGCGERVGNEQDAAGVGLMGNLRNLFDRVAVRQVCPLGTIPGLADDTAHLVSELWL